MERNKVTILKRRGGEGDEMVECGEQGNNGGVGWVDGRLRE